MIYYINNGTITNLTAPTVPDERPYTASRSNILVDGVVPWGSDNLFPDSLIELKRNSAVHAAIINSKRTYIVGKDVNYSDNKVARFVEAANGQESLREIAVKLAYDLVLYGNAVIEVVKSKGGIAIFHKDAGNYRIHKDGEHLIYNPAWYDRKKAEDVKLTMWPKYTNGSAMYMIKKYEPGQRWYGLPDYVAGMNAAAILYKTDKWNLSRLDNSFKASGLLLVDSDLSPDEAKRFEDDFDKKFSGEGNTGRVMKVIKDMASDRTKFLPLNENYDADWSTQQALSESAIITAHGRFRSLSGLADNTGFDTQRILQEYEIALNTVIYDYQSMLLDAFNRLARVEIGSADPGIDIINRPPLTVGTLLNVNKITKIWEGRKMLGLDYDDMDEQQQAYIDGDTRESERVGADA